MTVDGGASTWSDLRRNGSVSDFSSRFAASSRPPRRGFDDEWQPPLHPALFEWYFERETSRGIARHLQTAKGSPLFLGAPTVAAEANTNAALVDINPLVLPRLTRLRSLGRVETVSVEYAPYYALSGASVVFFDPPWYLDHTLHWLACALRMARRSGAVISFALFPDYVRAGAADERDLVLEIASSLGRVEVSSDALVYRTPGFERRALAGKAEGLSPSWRRGDLVTIAVRPGAIARALPTSAVRSAPSLSPRWRPFLVGDVVLAVRQGGANDAAASAPEFLAPIEGTDPYHLLLDSVSARDQRRAAIDLWSSGNLVARANRGVGRLVSRLSAMPKRQVREVICRNACRSSSWRILGQMILDEGQSQW